MMFVFYWLALAFGGVITIAAVALAVTALFRRRERWVLGGLAVGLVVLAWLPLVALFALFYAMGARPAGGPVPSGAKQATFVTPPAGPATAPFPAPGPAP